MIKYLITQSSKPTGFIGSILIKIWSNYFQDLSRWSLSNIDLIEKSIVLDFGFGGGANIKYIKEHNFTSASEVYGGDISEEAVRIAAELNKEYIDSGEVILALSNVSNLQFKDNFFDLIGATQTHIYWNKLKEGLTECYIVLRKNGILLITSELNKVIYNLPEYKKSDDFVSLLYKVGINEVNVRISNKYVAFNCIKSSVEHYA